MLKKYLIVTSIIFHVLILASLIWIVLFFKNSFEAGSEWAAAAENSEVGLVKDVAVIRRNGVPYVGYEIELNGQLLYLSGASDKKYKVNDEVDISISEHPYGPLNSLMITILGVHRSVDD